MASLPPAHHCPNTHKCTRVHTRTVPHSLTPSQHLCAVCRHHWRFPQLSICFSLYQFLPSFPCGCESNCKCSLRKEFISARGPSGHGRPGQEHEATHFCSQRAKMDAQPPFTLSRAPVPGLVLPSSGNISHAQLKPSGNSLLDTCRGASLR